MKLSLDHLAVAGASLDEASARVEEALGVALDPGGEHALMGTHNRLLSLGPGLYLEAIAVNPFAEPPGRSRWFDLDNMTGAARLSNWIVRTDELDSALALAPQGTGEPLDFVRGSFEWTMAVPRDGRLPCDGAAPALMQWRCDTHPSQVLTDRGCRLRRLYVRHPLVDALLAAFPALRTLDLVQFSAGEEPALLAEIDTPKGIRCLE
jgi:hypothetical protein